MPKRLKGLLLCAAILLIISHVTFAVPEVVRLFFFYSESCKDCQEVKTQVLPLLQDKYGLKLEIIELEISSLPNFELLLKLERQAGRRIDKTPPLILIGQDILEGAAAIRESLDDIIRKYQAQGGTDFPDKVLPRVLRGEPSVTEEFRKLSLAALISGALVDGINPCAFTTLIFLISYLAFIGRQGKQLLFSGFLFSFGVFAAYFSAGAGVFEAINQLHAFQFVDKALRWLAFLMSVVFGLLNLHDFLALKTGKNERLKLGLGDHLKQKIHAVIRTEKQAVGYLRSFFLGAAVGLLELPCTGQVYFPIIMMVREMSPVRVKAIAYMLLYNFIFILPLLAVFVGAYYGLSNQIMTKLVRDHLAKVKLLTALFFFGLALLLVYRF